MDKKTVQLIEEQAKELGNYFLPGAQAELRGLAISLNSEEAREAVYSGAMERLIALHALARKGRSYLERRAAQPELPMDAESTLEELLGHDWQLAELREHGRVRNGAELLQLSFLSYADHVRGEFVDAGWWADLEDGTIRVTRNLRPFRAAKSMREDDTVHAVVKTDELFVYPGETNAAAARISNKSIRYCETFVAEPKKTIFLLVSDLFEGGNQAEMIRRLRAMHEAGVKTIFLLALSYDGTPSYDEGVAKRLAEHGIPCFGCSPDKLPELIEGALKGMDLQQLAERFGQGSKK